MTFSDFLGLGWLRFGFTTRLCGLLSLLLSKKTKKGPVMLQPKATDEELIEFINNHPDAALEIGARAAYAPFTIAGQVVDRFVSNEYCEVVVTLKGRGPTQIEALRRALTGKGSE